MSIGNFIVFFVTNLFRIGVDFKFLGVFLEKDREKTFLHFITSMICFGTTSVGYLLFHKPEINIITNIVGLFFMALVFHGNIKKKILSVFFIYLINMMCDVIIVIAFQPYRVNLQVNELLGTMTTLLFIVCEVLVEKVIYVKKLSYFIVPHWRILLLVPICSMGMIHVLISTSLINRMLIIVEGIGLLLINLIVFFLYSAMEDTYLKNMEKEVAVQTSKIYSHQLDVIMSSQETVRSLQHDMKYHIRELLAMAEAKQMQDMVSYLNEMGEQSSNPDEYVYSGNKEIDGNLNYYLNVAKGKLNDVSVKVTVPDGNFISSFDINVIISNLLENAITAAVNSDEKSLHFEMVVEKSLLYITIINSYNGDIKEKKGRFYTIKEDKSIHGYGLKNVERIIRKYNGMMDVNYADRKFSTEIMMYLSNVIE